MADLKTIQVRGDFERYEALTSANVYPGEIVELASGGTIAPCNNEGTFCEKAFAVEDALQGDGVTDVIASGDLCQFNIQEPGNIVQGRVQDGQNITKGDVLYCGTAGRLRKVSTASGAVNNWPIGIALDSVNMSGSAGVDPSGFIKVRIV